MMFWSALFGVDYSLWIWMSSLGSSRRLNLTLIVLPCGFPVGL